MSDVVVNVARRGEGKTRWLLDVVHHYQNKDETIYIVTNTDDEYKYFCDKYLVTYSRLCRVEKFKSVEDVKNAIVLIDDLFDLDINMKQLKDIRANCKKLFITVEGTTTDVDNDEPETEYEQLTLFDMIK